MGLDESDTIDDGDGGGKSLSLSNVSCSICLEPVTDNGDRSWAKLQCGHEFHLDHDFMGQHAVFAEHTAVSSSTHQCPYVAYYGPIHSSSNSVGSVSDGSNFSNRWGGPSGPSEMPSSYAFPAVDPHYHGWEHQSLSFSANNNRLGGSDQPSAPSLTPRASRGNPDLTRSGSFVHPFIVNHSSGARVGSSVTSSMVPPYPGSAARARDRVQALQAYFQPPSTSPPMRVPPPIMPSTRRSSGHRGLSQGAPLPSSSDQTAGGFFMFPSGTSNRSFPEAENPVPNRFHGWDRDHLASFPITQGDRDSSWLPHHGAGGSRQRHGSERTPSHNWS
ncbi:E3 ubiquitin-protein ligase RFI2 [Bienertia sinuspersici]